MPCSSTSQLTNAPATVLPLTQPQTPSQWNYFVARLQDIINSIRDASNRQPVNVVPIAYAVYNGSALPALTVAGATAALDGTKAQFGKASLKLTATAPTVTISFSGDPIVIQPFVRWIESVYITSSRTSIAGTLAVITPSKSYPADISGTLIPATWGRLYGDCDLTADASTAATLTLTLTGCTVGDTFNLEGWQLEQSAGTSLPSPFVNTAAPADYVVTVQNVTTAQTTANTALDQLGNLSNSQYLRNPFFSTGDLTGWTSDHHTVYFESGTNGPASGSTSYAVFPHGTAAEALRNAGKIPVYPGAVIKAQCAVRGVGTPNGVCGVRISWRDASDAEISTTAGNTSTGNATNGTYVTGTAPAGAMFAHVECATAGRTDTGGYYTVDNFAAWALADTLDQVPDSGTRFAAAETGADKTAGKSLTVLTDRNLDNIADSPSYSRSMQAFVSETVDNADFSLPLDVNGKVPGWSGQAATVSVTPFVYYTAPQAAVATATSATVTFWGIGCDRKYPIKPGDSVHVSAALLCGSGFTESLFISFFDASGVGLGSPSLPATPGAWTIVSFNAVAPAGTVSFRIFALSPSAAPVGTQIYLDQVRVSINDLRQAGSGQTIGDQRNLQPITWASQRSVLSNSPISFSISGTTVNFSVAAVTLQGGGISLHYAASSGSVSQSAGTTSTYFLYYRDSAQAGGSLPLAITTNPGGAASFPDSIFLGTASVTVNSGGGGSGGTGGGGGGYCVADDMFIAPGRLAGDAEIGDPFDCIDLPTQAGKHQRALQGVSRGVEECVRMITSDGCALVCSVSTPFDLPDGRNTTALHMLGEQVITDLGVATVTSLSLVGPRPVTRAHLGGVSYAAGADPARRIYSHNVGAIKP